MIRKGWMRLHQDSQWLVEARWLPVSEMFQPLTTGRARAIPIHARTNSGDFRQPVEGTVNKRDRLSWHDRSASARAVLHNAAEVISSVSGSRNKRACLPWLAGAGYCITLHRHA